MLYNNPRNKPPVIFLGGPIQYAASKDGTFDPQLRQRITDLLHYFDTQGYKVLSAHRYEQFGAVDMTGKSEEVARRDFAWMQACDLFAAILPPQGGRPLRTDGTFIELGWASALKKPVLLFRDPEVVGSHLLDGLGSLTYLQTLPLDAVYSAQPALDWMLQKMIAERIRVVTV